MNAQLAVCCPLGGLLLTALRAWNANNIRFPSESAEASPRVPRRSGGAHDAKPVGDVGGRWPAGRWEGIELHPDRHQTRRVCGWSLRSPPPSMHTHKHQDHNKKTPRCTHANTNTNTHEHNVSTHTHMHTNMQTDTTTCIYTNTQSSIQQKHKTLAARHTQTKQASKQTNKQTHKHCPSATRRQTHNPKYKSTCAHASISTDRSIHTQMQTHKHTNKQTSKQNTSNRTTISNSHTHTPGTGSNPNEKPYKPFFSPHKGSA